MLASKSFHRRQNFSVDPMVFPFQRSQKILFVDLKVVGTSSSCLVQIDGSLDELLWCFNYQFNGHYRMFSIKKRRISSAFIACFE